MVSQGPGREPALAIGMLRRAHFGSWPLDLAAAGGWLPVVLGLAQQRLAASSRVGGCAEGQHPSLPAVLWPCQVVVEVGPGAKVPSNWIAM